jgi:hypothetical protein
MLKLPALIQRNRKVNQQANKGQLLSLVLRFNSEFVLTPGTDNKSLNKIFIHRLEF